MPRPPSSTCKLDLSRNRTVDFYAIDIQVPGPPPGGGDDEGPKVTFSGAGRTFTASAKGTVALSLGPFAEAVNGKLALKTAGKVQASKAKVLALGSKSFSARAGRKVTVKVKLTKKAKAYLKKAGTVRAKATVTARDAAGNPTVKRFALKLKRAKRR